jgi:hypothetical protein
MKAFLYRLFLLGIGIVVGFALGRFTADKPNPQQIHAVAVDCYDVNGNLVPDPFAKFGGVRLECPVGQAAKLHQSH